MRFCVDDTTASPLPKGEIVEPWRVIKLDEAYGGNWVVAGDVDGDGEVEIVSCRNVNENDVHYTSTAVAQKLDGSVLWRWGDPEIGRRKLHHDVACQIHDWDGDGKQEVVLATDGAVVELDGAAGEERRRFEIPKGASDCIVFCDLAGVDRPTDVLVKTRYGQICSYNHAGELLWTVKMPGGSRTAHQPRPIDIDGDGKDEIMAGYALLNPDGSVRWVVEFKETKKDAGHLDCCRVVRRGETPEDFRLVLTCCGANSIAMVDGNGRVLWERLGYHFESVGVGRILPDTDGLQLVVDIDHQPFGQGPLWVLNEAGQQVAQINTDYCRQHRLLDWNGDGLDEIVVGNNLAIYDYEGRRMASLGVPGGGGFVHTGDMTGDGVPNILVAAGHTAYVFENKGGAVDSRTAELGTGLNVTLY